MALKDERGRGQAPTVGDSTALPGEVVPAPSGPSSRPWDAPNTASRGLIRGVAWGCVLVLAVTVPAVVFAAVQLPILPGFTWAYVTVYAITGLVTAVLLLQASPEDWSWSLTLLTAGYVYSALATVPFLLCFPGAFTADEVPLLGGPSSGPWAFYLWQGGFLLFVLASTLLRRAEQRRGAGDARTQRSAPAGRAALIIGSSAAVVLSVVVLAVGPALPDLIGEGATEQKSTTFHVLSWTVVALGVVVLAAAVSVARRGGALRVWLVPVVLLTTVQAVQLPDSGRYKLGWYAPRVLGMLAATVLLVVLLVQVWRQAKALAAARSLSDVQRRQTGYDLLTGLVNRENLLSALDGTTGQEALGVVLLNLNGMADINEAIGHRGGDEVLVGVRDRLLTVIRPGDVLARYGGDVFAVVRHSPAGEQEVHDLARSLTGVLDGPFYLGDVELILSATAGSVFCDGVGRAHRDVLRLADAALKAARRQGRGALHHSHVSEGTESSTPRLAAELELRRALAERRVFCLYQPVVTPTSRKVVGVEALARIRLADGTLLPPVLFIPLASELGLLDQLTEQVLDLAGRQSADWARAGTPLPVAINIAPSWVTRDHALLIRTTLALHGLPATALGLEITEDQAANLSDEALEVLHEVAGWGMGIAIDDFGTGYASLASFRDVPSTVLKIDRSFVSGMLRSQDNYDLVASMVELGHRFGKTVIAEGVETDDQLAALATLDCDHVQGYLTGRPMPAEDVPLGLRAVTVLPPQAVSL